MRELFFVYIAMTVILSCKNMPEKKVDTIELMDGTSIDCETLTKHEYVSLKAQATERLDYSLDGYEVDVQKLSDGRVIVKSEDYYTLYFTLDDFTKVLNDAKATSGGREVMLNKNPLNDGFAEKETVLISDLLSEIGIEFRKLDYELLRTIDERLVQMDDKELFCQRHFLSLIALVGGTLKAKYNIEWKMKLAGDGNTWNPYLIINEHEIAFFVYLYEEIFLQKAKSIALLSDTYMTVSDIIKSYGTVKD